MTARAILGDIGITTKTNTYLNNSLAQLYQNALFLVEKLTFNTTPKHEKIGLIFNEFGAITHLQLLHAALVKLIYVYDLSER
jgi:hypothetical protein